MPPFTSARVGILLAAATSAGSRMTTVRLPRLGSVGGLTRGMSGSFVGLGVRLGAVVGFERRDQLRLVGGRLHLDQGGVLPSLIARGNGVLELLHGALGVVDGVAGDQF